MKIWFELYSFFNNPFCNYHRIQQTTKSYSMLLYPNKYDVLVQFNIKCGAMNYFNKVGVMHSTAAGARTWTGRGNQL
ncbi:hypothetical protein FHR29_000840 [Sphingobacterium sp. JUb56]|nr:hypothetical protein [Sphingobacterium sp. JUb56]